MALLVLKFIGWLKTRHPLNIEVKLLTFEVSVKLIAESKALLTSHPVYQYAARAYSLNIRALHWEPDTVLGEKELRELKELLKGHPAKIMIWEGTPSMNSQAILKAEGINSIIFSPTAQRPQDKDFLQSMRANVKNLLLSLDTQN